MPKPTRRRASRTSRPSARGVPAGFGTVTPYLSVARGVEALEFYKKAFGAKELARQLSPNGKLIHGRLRIGDSIVMLSDVFPGADTAAPSSVGTTTVRLHIYSNDVETLWNRAVAAGATVTMPLDDQFWGERYGHLEDPFGHKWSLGTRVAMKKSVRDQKRREAMAAFSRGEHPSKEPEFGDA